MNRSAKGKKVPFKGTALWAKPTPLRPRVNRDQVIQQALEVLDMEGFDGLTMRRLAEHLQIKAASLYNHVNNKEELLALVADAVCVEIPNLDQLRPWRAQLESVAFQLRAVLKAHRDSARVLASTPPFGPMRLRIVEQVLNALLTAGFSPAEAADAASVHNSYVVGFVLDETMGYPTEKTSIARRRAEGRRRFKSLPLEQYPTLVSLADELADTGSDRSFEFGIRALLDGFELRLARKCK